MLTKEQVEISSRQTRAYFNKHLAEMKESFNVPGVIGPHGATAKSKGIEPCPFPDYKTFVKQIHASDLDRIQ